MGRYLSTLNKSLNPAITKTPDIFGTGAYRVYTSSDTFTVPIGVGKVRVTVMGAGGGAGGNWRTSCNIWRSTSYNCAGVFGYAGTISQGGSGGGGGFSIGTSNVTPGCVCCVVVGSAGTSGTSYARYYVCCWSSSYYCSLCTNLCGTDGNAGGYSCAFGICATGGSGGQGGKCVLYSLCACFAEQCQANFCHIAGCSCCNCAIWNDLATNCLPNVKPLGGAGGMGYGGFYNVCGGSGGDGNYIASVSSPVMSSSGNGCCNNYITRHDVTTCSGAPGGILGQPTYNLMPNLFNGKAFDGSTDSESTLLYKYDLQPSKWIGERIYSQAPGSSGSPCYFCCIVNNCCCGSMQFTCCTTYCKALYSGGTSDLFGSSCCVNPVASPAYYYGYCCTVINNYGAGALPSPMYHTSSLDSGGSGYCITCSIPNSAIAAGNGFVVVEW